VDHETQWAETPFSKACSYLNFNPSAKWAAYVAAAAQGLVLLALLTVLWLFADLMVWRGRVPSARELSEVQRAGLETRWQKASPEDRRYYLEQAGFAAKARELPAGTADISALSEAELEGVWEEMVWEILHDNVGEAAAWRVFTQPDPSSGYVLDRSDHGVLSLVVREVVGGRRLGGRVITVVPWLASWNRWMWNGPPDSRGPVPSYLTGLTLVAAILGLLWGLLVILNREMAARATIEATNRLRRAVYHHTFRLGTLAIRALGPSEAVSILTRHIEALHDALYARLTTVLIREPVTFACLLLFAVLVDPLLTLAFILFAVVVWQVGLRLVSGIRAQTRLANNVAAERLTIIRESLMLMRLVKCYLMEQFNQARIERQLARYAQVQRIRHRGESLAWPALVLLGGLCALVLAFVAALFVLYGRLSAAGAVVLATTLLCLYRPVENWLEARKLLRRGREAAAQVFGFLERKGEVGQVVGAEFLPPLAKQIEFDNVTLKDPSNGRVLLDEVSITIPAGQRIGLAGSDNLEKHALVYLIPRLLDPSAGEIRIDQHNLRWVTLDSLRNQIGIVMMHNLVFHDTVRNNIGCGDPNYTLPQVIEAAKMAHAHHFIQRLPNGYETPIGELGHPLSLSEQYRIALARAILRDPALLIIEEPDSDLDEDTKNLLDDSLARFLPGRTGIFLPHRISTLKACNTIHLMNKGRIVASGTHKELLASNKLYRHLHYLEFNEMDEAV
jgi:ATP-binding cassette subfamily B protein